MKAQPEEEIDLSELVIREMELDDLSAVFSLGEKLFTAEKWPSLYRTWDEYEVVGFFESDGEFCYAAELDGKIVGFALGTIITKRKNAWVYGYVVWLGVKPKLKGKGVGKRLLKRLTDVFIKHGVRMMLVDTDSENEHAIGFFRKNGFSNEVGHVFLTKNLQRKKRRRVNSLSPPTKKSHSHLKRSGIADKE
ncbi:GNAT family N-acetyltransferase [Candidatus Peregrinibacteria bacterium]|nr:GNAT family N-acetyltransferase [Candidatus Peregrinibacteria bacterium]